MGNSGSRKAKTTIQKSNGANLGFERELWQAADALRGSMELILFRQPYTKGQFLVDAGIAKRQTAAEYLKELEKIGVLKAHKVGKGTIYLNVGLYGLLLR